MPDPAAIFLKALLFFGVAAPLFLVAQQVETVEVTVFSEGTMSRSAVSADDMTYRDELDVARKRARWFYLLSGFFALIGIFMLRKSVRVYLRRRTARDHFERYTA